MARIIYTFSFSSEDSVNANLVLGSSRYYSFMDKVYNMVFVKTGLISILWRLDTSVKAVLVSFYSSLVNSSKLAGVLPIFSGNALSLNDPFVKTAILNFSNDFYKFLDISRIIFLNNSVSIYYITSVNNYFFVKFFDKFISDIK